MTRILHKAGMAIGMVAMLTGASLYPSPSHAIQSIVTLKALGQPQTLSGGYGLPVVELASVPPLHVRAGSMSSRKLKLAATCPFDVKAVVASSPTDETGFVIFSYQGESWVVKMMESFTHGSKVYQLKSVHPKQVILRQSRQVLICLR